MVRLFYTCILYPLMFCFFAAASLVSRKIRKGFLPRFRTISIIEKWCAQNNYPDDIVLYHAASLGEFEHLKPIFLKLKKKFHIKNVVTIFSPSGYEHAKNVRGVDLIIYMPFDRGRTWKRFYELLKPKMIIISKHDVWPQQIWSADRQKIPAFLINASLSQTSSRLRPGIRYLLKNIYSRFKRIYAISSEDAQRFSIHFNIDKILTAGDTKYDQVIARKISGEKESLIAQEWYKDKFIFIGGSVWPDDLDHVAPACIRSFNLGDDIRIILAPHQPEDKIIKMITDTFSEWGVARLSDPVLPDNARVLVVDSVGSLATLYKYAKVAYIGGSFSQGIHNVMEAATYGIPILYGPVHNNSYEAVQLQEKSGGIVIKNSDELYHWLGLFYHNNQERMHIGRIAEAYVDKNAGAVERIVNDLSVYFEGERR